VSGIVSLGSSHCDNFLFLWVHALVTR